MTVLADAGLAAAVIPAVVASIGAVTVAALGYNHAVNSTEEPAPAAGVDNTKELDTLRQQVLTLAGLLSDCIKEKDRERYENFTRAVRDGRPTDTQEGPAPALPTKRHLQKPEGEEPPPANTP